MLIGLTLQKGMGIFHRKRLVKLLQVELREGLKSSP